MRLIKTRFLGSACFACLPALPACLLCLPGLPPAGLLPADHQEWTPTQAEGAAAALKAGTDLACEDYSHLR